MKSKMVWFLCFAAASLNAAPPPVITLTNNFGQVVTNAQIVRVLGGSAIYRSATGGGRVPLSTLPAEVRLKLGDDAVSPAPVNHTAALPPQSVSMEVEFDGWLEGQVSKKTPVERQRFYGELLAAFEARKAEVKSLCDAVFEDADDSCDAIRRKYRDRREVDIAKREAEKAKVTDLYLYDHITRGQRAEMDVRIIEKYQQIERDRVGGEALEQMRVRLAAQKLSNGYLSEIFILEKKEKILSERMGL